MKKKEHRTPADAIRLTAVLLTVDNRSSVSRFLSNKRTREMLDQAVDPDVALFEQLLSTFIDPDFNEINRPDEMNVVDEDHSILPNDKSVFTNKERDAKWLLQTWTDYLRPKYRKFWKKFNKDTGGGGRELSDVKLYTSDGKLDYPWLTWVYYLDSKNNFLLASSVLGGLIGDHVLTATGVEVSNDAMASHTSSPTKKSPTKADALIGHINESRKSVDKIMSIASDIVETIKDRNNANAVANSNENKSCSTLIDELWNICSKITDLEEGKIPVEDKDGILRVLNSQKRKIEEKLVNN